MGDTEGTEFPNTAPATGQLKTQKLISPSSGGWRQTVNSLVSPLIRTLILLGQGPTLLTSFDLNYLLKARFPNTVPIWD